MTLQTTKSLIESRDFHTSDMNVRARIQSEHRKFERPREKIQLGSFKRSTSSITRENEHLKQRCFSFSTN